MQRQYAMSSVPLLGGFPETGFPASGYYGVDTTLKAVQAGTASGGSDSGAQPQHEMPNTRTLIVAFIAVVGAVALWHFYMR